MGENDTSQVDAIATGVARKLASEHFVLATIPKWAAEWLIKATGGNGIRYQTWVPLYGPEQLGVLYSLSPSGAIHLELRTSSGETFWEGTLTPPRNIP